MVKYEYVTVKINEKVFSAQYSEHRKIIDNYAQKGHKYVGFIPISMTNYGRFKEIDLVFEICHE